MAIEFKAGEFVALRATGKFHLGAIERDLAENDVVQFDGQTIKIGGKDHNLPSIAGAVRAGWLVPIEDTTSKLVSLASTGTTRPALSVGRERGEAKSSQMVHDEERDLGKLAKVRDHGDGIVRRGQVIQEDGGQEGTAVGKIKSASNMKTTLTAENSMKVAQDIHRMDNTQGAPDKKTVVSIKATGDVQEARSGDTLDELLEGAEDVISAHKQAAGKAGEGNDPGSTQTEKDEKAQRLAAATAAANAAKAARLAQVGVTVATPVPVPKFPMSAPVEVEVTENIGNVTAKMAMVRLVIPKFEWDLTRPWKMRVTDAVKQHGKDATYLFGIMAVETDTVKKYLTEYIQKSNAPSAG